MFCTDSTGLHIEGRAVRRDPDQSYAIGSEGRKVLFIMSEASTSYAGISMFVGRKNEQFLKNRIKMI